MEVAGSEILWKRVLSQNFRYTIILTDGGAKNFNRRLKLNINGHNFIIRNEECIKHFFLIIKTTGNVTEISVSRIVQISDR